MGKVNYFTSIVCVVVSGAAASYHGIGIAGTGADPASGSKCSKIELKRKAGNTSSPNPYKRAFFRLPSAQGQHCLKVGGEPIETDNYLGNSKILTFTPPSATEARVILTYCMERSDLFEECLVPKDSFLAALEGKSGGNAPAAEPTKDNNAQILSGNDRKDSQTVTLAKAVDPKIAKDLFTWEEWQSMGPAK